MMTEVHETPSQRPETDGLARRVADAASRLFPDGLRASRSRPLPLLADIHPRASHATRRWRGSGVIPVAAIVGTASALPGTRRTDFMPTSGHEPADWRARWSRLEDAARSQTPLPPIELVKAGDGYWVTDGHNRVALARSIGQLWIDADVTEVVVPAPAQPTISSQRGTT